MRRGSVAAILACVVAAAGAARTLDIYFIDVEGGQSTLIVTPAGESLLVDTGWAGYGGRDADRIVAAAKAAGIERIDYLLLTHFHSDHAGGVPELAKRMPIRTFVDHDAIVPTDTNSAPVFKAYEPVRARGRHIVAKAGDTLPLNGVDVRVVSSDGRTIAAPVDGDGRANPSCPASAPPPAEPVENPRSTGIQLKHGRFRFIDLGDLSGQPLFALVCPKNLLGTADVYLVPHHGGADVVYPATFAVNPRVAIFNNGEGKGGARDAFTEVRRVRSLEDVWQLHRSNAAGPQNFPDDRIANLDETTGHWIKVSANEDGTFSVTNGRTGATKTYR
jgi:beta-lactamase superfamily II metal-dependent hydrolase